MLSPMLKLFVAHAPYVVPPALETPRLKPPPPLVRMLILHPKVVVVPVVKPASVPSVVKELPNVSTRKVKEKKISPDVKFAPSGRRRLMLGLPQVRRLPAEGCRPAT